MTRDGRSVGGEGRAKDFEVENSAVSAGSEAVDHREIMAIKAAANYRWRDNEVDRPRCTDVENAAVHPFPVENVLRPALGLVLPVSFRSSAFVFDHRPKTFGANTPSAMSMEFARSGNPCPENCLEHEP